MPVDFPNELTKKYWDKKKPTLAKSKSTGIGEALDDLETSHGKIKWANFTAQNTLAGVDAKLKAWPKVFADEVEPVAKEADEVIKLLNKWSATFTKDKLMPKAAATLCDEIAGVAKKFAAELRDFEGVQALEFMEMRKDNVEKVKKMMVTSLGIALKKSDGLIKDIVAFAKDPTEDNFWVYFKGDGNARGYTTGCKNWDQLMVEFPQVRKECFDGVAMDVYFPCMADYGANYDKNKFETQVNSKRKEKGEELWKAHAAHLVNSIPKVKEFQKILAKALTMKI